MLVNVLWRELVSILHDKNEKKYDVEPFDITQIFVGQIGQIVYV